MELIIDDHGVGFCLYGEELDLSAIGDISVRRASHVEPDDDGDWWADLAPVDGPMLGPFERRSAALGAEVEWLRRHLSSLITIPQIRNSA